MHNHSNLHHEGLRVLGFDSKSSAFFQRRHGLMVRHRFDIQNQYISRVFISEASGEILDESGALRQPDIGRV